MYIPFGFRILYTVLCQTKIFSWADTVWVTDAPSREATIRPKRLFFDTPYTYMILVTDSNPWPFCPQYSIQKTGFHYLTYVEFAEAWFHAQRYITCSAYAPCPLLMSCTAVSAWKSVPSSGTRILWARKEIGGSLRFCVLWSKWSTPLITLSYLAMAVGHDTSDLVPSLFLRFIFTTEEGLNPVDKTVTSLRSCHLMAASCPFVWNLCSPRSIFSLSFITQPTGSDRSNGVQTSFSGACASIHSSEKIVKCYQLPWRVYVGDQFQHNTFTQANFWSPSILFGFTCVNGKFHDITSLWICQAPDFISTLYWFQKHILF